MSTDDTPRLLEWDGPGYDIFRDPPKADGRGEPASDWSLIHRSVAAARNGDRSLVARLPAICARTRDFATWLAAATIIGDAGDARAIESLLPFLEAEQSKSGLDFELGLKAARALAVRGRLVDVPAVFFFYELNQHVKDADIIGIWLSRWLLDRESPGFAPADRGEDTSRSWQDYRRDIGQRYFEIWNKLGTNLVHVHHGHVFDLERVARDMLADLREHGHIFVNDRHVFEATTGLSCSSWYRDDGRMNGLRAGADLERFSRSRKTGILSPGERAFLGHPLELAAAASEVLDEYPPNNGMGVPDVRTTFDIDGDFALRYGLDFRSEGYFYRSPKPGPTAMVTSTSTPWVAFHAALRDAKAGERHTLGVLARLLKPGMEYFLSRATAELLGVAADRHQIAHWHSDLETATDVDYLANLCSGLTLRGLLSDVPHVVKALPRFAAHENASYVRFQLNELLSLAPVTPAKELGKAPDIHTYTTEISKAHFRLVREFGAEDVPVFRGQLASPENIAREVISLQRGPFLRDLRERFERTTGIDCSSWVSSERNEHGGFDHARASATATAFLQSPDAAQYDPRMPYFFGWPISP